MTYLTSLLVAGGGALVLAVLLLRLVGPARRLARAARSTRDAIRDRTGVLTARAAALRVELDRRRGRRSDPSGA